MLKDITIQFSGFAKDVAVNTALHAFTTNDREHGKPAILTQPQVLQEHSFSKIRHVGLSEDYNVSALAEAIRNILPGSIVSEPAVKGNETVLTVTR